MFSQSSFRPLLESLQPYLSVVREGREKVGVAIKEFLRRRKRGEGGNEEGSWGGTTLVNEGGGGKKDLAICIKWW